MSDTMNKSNNQSQQNQMGKLFKSDLINLPKINSVNFDFKANNQIIFYKLKLPKIELKMDTNEYDSYIIGVSPSMR
jgi:hypothetical protein